MKKIFALMLCVLLCLSLCACGSGSGKQTLIVGFDAEFPPFGFIAADGSLVARASGAIDADTLQKGIDMINTQS